MPSIKVVFVAAVALAAASSSANAFVVVPTPSTTATATSRTTCLGAEKKNSGGPNLPFLKPNAKQQEQIDKYGQTPETGMEMLFDKLSEAPEWMVSAVSGGKDSEWSKLLKGLKKGRDKKKMGKEEYQKMKLEEYTKRLEAEQAAAKAAEEGGDGGAAP